jgi:hypothetical protein
MMFTMLRRCLTAVALAALVAVGTFAPASSAEARGGGNLFAGTYVGAVPGFVSYVSWTVTISDAGRITSSYSNPDNRYKRSISGKVSADGSYSFTVSETFPTLDDPERPHHGPAWHTSTYESVGNMAPDALGNIIGTSDTGESFTWLRQ